MEKKNTQEDSSKSIPDNTPKTSLALRLPATAKSSGDAYADACADAYADACCDAYADACSDAYADACADAYADACCDAYADACCDAYADAWCDTSIEADMDAVDEDGSGHDLANAGPSTRSTRDKQKHKSASPTRTRNKKNHKSPSPPKSPPPHMNDWHKRQVTWAPVRHSVQQPPRNTSDFPEAYAKAYVSAYAVADIDDDAYKSSYANAIVDDSYQKAYENAMDSIHKDRDLKTSVSGARQKNV
ncbi:hypothetical protein ACFE04_018716 [Oxalis oulophora]